MKNRSILRFDGRCGKNFGGGSHAPPDQVGKARKLVTALILALRINGALDSAGGASARACPRPTELSGNDQAAEKLSGIVLVCARVKHVRRVAADKLSNILLVDTRVKHVWSSMDVIEGIYNWWNSIRRADHSDQSREPNGVILPPANQNALAPATGRATSRESPMASFNHRPPRTNC